MFLSCTQYPLSSDEALCKLGQISRPTYQIHSAINFKLKNYLGPFAPVPSSPLELPQSSKNSRILTKGKPIGWLNAVIIRENHSQRHIAAENIHRISLDLFIIIFFGIFFIAAIVNHRHDSSHHRIITFTYSLSQQSKSYRKIL